MTKNVLARLLVLAGLAPRIALAGIIGEPAPPLMVKEWIQGGPVELKPGTNIYVVEFWNTAGANSRACITNLNAIQSRFKTSGVVAVGISEESPEMIKRFVQNYTASTNGYGAIFDYALAADERRGTAIHFMTPIKQSGIPYAFIVGTNGTVAWHGSPFGELNQALALILAGKYDAGHQAKREIAGHQLEQYIMLARKGDFRTAAAATTVLAYRTNDVSLLCDLAYVISTVPNLPHRDFTLAGEALGQAEKIASTNDLPTVMSIRAVWLFASGKPDQGLPLATQALASAQSPADQNRIKLLLHTMEAQLAAAKAKASNTNTNTDHVEPVPAPKPATAVSTNPPDAK